MTIELRLGIHVGEKNVSWQFYKEWAGRLNKISEGEVKIDVVYNGFVGIEEWNMLKSGEIKTAS